jgi:hypothetical protein
VGLGVWKAQPKMAQSKTGQPIPAATSATVEVISNPPGAMVLINGARQALLTPNKFAVARAPEVQLRVEKDGFKPREGKVVFAAEENYRLLELTLQPEAGSLEVRTNATEASWFFDNQPAGDGSGTFRQSDIPPGVHTLRVEGKGFAIKEQQVQIESRQRAVFEWALKKSRRSSTTAAEAAPEAVAAKPAAEAPPPAEKPKPVADEVGKELFGH